MSPDTIATLAAAAVIVGFLWSLHRDVSDLRERMARLEGTVERPRWTPHAATSDTGRRNHRFDCASLEQESAARGRSR